MEITSGNGRTLDVVMRKASDFVIDSSFRLCGFGALLGKITPRTDLYADQALDI